MAEIQGEKVSDLVSEARKISLTPFYKGKTDEEIRLILLDPDFQPRIWGSINRGKPRIEYDLHELYPERKNGIRDYFQVYFRLFKGMFYR